MYSFVLLACTSFLFALLLTPLIRNAALGRAAAEQAVRRKVGRR